MSACHCFHHAAALCPPAPGMHAHTCSAWHPNHVYGLSYVKVFAAPGVQCCTCIVQSNAVQQPCIWNVCPACSDCNGSKTRYRQADVATDGPKGELHMLSFSTQARLCWSRRAIRCKARPGMPRCSATLYSLGRSVRCKAVVSDRLAGTPRHATATEYIPHPSAYLTPLILTVPYSQAQLPDVCEVSNYVPHND